MNAAPARGNHFRLLWLLLVTASAVALTDYLFDPNSESMPGGICFGLFAAAWLTVLLAWRWHRRYLRSWSPGLIFVVVTAETFAVSAVRNSLFACPLLPSTPQEMYVYAPSTPREEYSSMFDDGAFATQGEPSPLTEATDRNDVPMMRLLLRHGASVSDDTTGNSLVLWDAVLHGKAEAVDCLLKAGASPLTAEVSPIDNKTGWSVLHLARYTGNNAIVRRLKQAGATK